MMYYYDFETDRFCQFEISFAPHCAELLGDMALFVP